MHNEGSRMIRGQRSPLLHASHADSPTRLAGRMIEKIAAATTIG